ncbi:MAG: hypothetical protein JXB88_19140 [Spirochaetales bacterium]|nr:hypothetical protein [Spirochaetales bacterium]
MCEWVILCEPAVKVKWYIDNSIVASGGIVYSDIIKSTVSITGNWPSTNGLSYYTKSKDFSGTGNKSWEKGVAWEKQTYKIKVEVKTTRMYVPYTGMEYTTTEDNPYIYKEETSFTSKNVT